jgi:F-type H+-transporting ATPase subunit delta
MLRGSSAEVLADLRAALGTSHTLEEDATLGRELFGVTGVLRREPALRPRGTDTTVEPEARAAVARDVFGKAVGERTLRLVGEAVSRRWTRTTDLADALEQLGVVATVRSAGARGRTVGDELFAVRRLVEENYELRDALADQGRSAEDRVGLARRLLGEKVQAATLTLVEQAVSAGRGNVSSTLEDYQQLAAAELGATVAVVHAARPLSDDELDRLTKALGRQYDTEIDAHVVVDPELIGGVRVEIGDEVIDGTVVSRLADARRRLAG